MSKCRMYVDKDKDNVVICERCLLEVDSEWFAQYGPPQCRMNHLMVDIETLGSGPRSVITQIGACYFDLNGNVGGTFEANINIQSALDVGLVIDGDTIKWWFGQPKEAQTFVKNTDTIITVLRRFQNFCVGAEHVWSHATFDMPIIFNAYRECGIKIPFHYRTPRDIRTLCWLWGGDYEDLKKQFVKENAHDALSDSIYQVKYVAHCYKEIENARN